jgi:hypothetical protein
MASGNFEMSCAKGGMKDKARRWKIGGEKEERRKKKANIERPTLILVVSFLFVISALQ